MNGCKRFFRFAGLKPAASLIKVKVLLGWVKKIRIIHIPIIAAVVSAEFLSRRGFAGKPSWKAPAPLKYSAGLSIIIPERGSVSMLENCLTALYVSLQEIKEPFEVIVVVNGSPLLDYTQLKDRFAGVCWIHVSKPLGFTEAIGIGLKNAHHDWVYLLNNDMTLTPASLKYVLDWRTPNTFAVASQIFFTGIERPRKETGWTTIRIDDGITTPYHLTPEDRETVRGTLYAGAGSSLFNRHLLKKIIRRRDPYHPFYWEDVDWSIRAWRLGYDVLFCPKSVVFHEHRATISRFYDQDTVDRVFERNRLQFGFYNPLAPRSLKKAIRQIVHLDHETLSEIGNLRNCISILAAALWTYGAPFRDIPWKYLAKKYYSTPYKEIDHRPRMIVITPYVVYPPAHGGAVRTHNLILELSKDFSVILISDEEMLYDHEKSLDYMKRLHSAHLIGGRHESESEARNRISRIRNHSHRILESEAARCISGYQPALVQVEYMELGKLATLNMHKPPMVLILVDVLLNPHDTSSQAEDRFEINLIEQFDQVVVCCKEDAALLKGFRPIVILNGANPGENGYASSTERNAILFAGPFRCETNWVGICIFLEEVYPELVKSIPDVQLIIVGGYGAKQTVEDNDARTRACFNQPGVRVLDYVEDMSSLLNECALTINLHQELRGSSLKLIESVVSGRVCVSTREGARGFLEAGFPSLVVAETIADFLSPIRQLLLDEPYRLSIEKPSVETLQSYSWETCVRPLRERYRVLGSDQDK